jgi:DNA ligase D-like protein (predicted polymerase)
MHGDAPPEVITVAGRDVTVSNPDKVLFPGAGYTKRDLAQYYVAVSDGALRAAGGRPNVLVRYPNGIDGEFFFQKRAPRSRPPWIDVATLQFPSGRSAEEVVPRDAAALVWMASLACLELHPHPVRADDLDHPDELRIDLDPVPDVPWAQVRDVAGVVDATLRDFDLIGWPKTSGKRGLRVPSALASRFADLVREAVPEFEGELLELRGDEALCVFRSARQALRWRCGRSPMSLVRHELKNRFGWPRVSPATTNSFNSQQTPFSPGPKVGSRCFCFVAECSSNKDSCNCAPNRRSCGSISRGRSAKVHL